MNNFLKLSVSLSAISSLLLGNTFAAEEVTHQVRNTGKIIGKEKSRIFVSGRVRIDKGSDSTKNDEDTGAIHNHDQIIILSGGSFTGGGKIVNYESISKDAKRTSERDSVYAATKPTNLKEENALKDASYYDFANRSNPIEIKEFHTVNGATIAKSNANSKEEYESSSTPSREIITYNSSKVGVKVEPRGASFVQKNTDADKSYYLGGFAERGGLTSVHSSANKDEIKGSMHTLHGYTKLTREQTLQGLINNGHKFKFGQTEVNPENASEIIRNNKNLTLTETIDGKSYTTKIDENGIVNTTNPNQVAALPSSQKGTAFSFERKLDSGVYSYIPVLIPKVDENLVIAKTMPEGEERNKYEARLNNELEESRKNGSFVFEEWKSDDPVTSYSGQNSWYNGVFKLEHGAVIIPNTAGLFGGEVDLGKVPDGFKDAKAFHDAIEKGEARAISAAKSTSPTEFEFEGGPKDEYNRPDIYMNGNSSLFFNVAEDTAGKRIFSFYGSLHGTEQDRLIIQNGEIRWKGDGSGFKGNLAITENATFEVRSSDAGSSSVYNGRFPNANIYQIYGEDGDGHKSGDLVESPRAKTTIDTAGIQDITINNGYIRLINDGNEDNGKLTLERSTLERNSFVEIAGKSEVKDVVVKGVAVADGNMQTENLTLEGGVLAVQGSVEAKNANVGSTIALWGNNRIDRNLMIGTSSDPGALVIRDNHTLKLFIDANPRTGETDGVQVQRGTVIHSGNGVQIGGINFINSALSAAGDSRTFQVISGGTATNIPVEIGALYSGETNATFVAYQNVSGFTALPTPVTAGSTDPNSDTRYTYGTVASGTMLQTEPLNDGTGGWSIRTADGKEYCIYGSNMAGYGRYMISKSQGNGFVVPVQSMHMTALSDVPQIFGLVTDEYGYADKYQSGKFEFWSKPFGGKDDFETELSSNIKSINYGTISGFDSKPTAIRGGTTEFMATIFGGVSRKHMKFTYQQQEHKVKQNGYIAGFKGAFFNRKFNLDLIGSYQFVKTTSKKYRYSANIKSHLYSFGMTAAYKIDFSKNVSIRPGILVDYTFAKTPNYSVISRATTKTKDINRIDIAPGIALHTSIGRWRTSLFASYHRRFGSKGEYEFKGEKYNDITKKKHVEFGIGMDRVALNNRSKISLKITKKVGGVKGIKASLNIGFKF